MFGAAAGPGLVLGDDTTPLRAEHHASLPPGPVIALGQASSTASEGPYRGDVLPGDFELLPGERAEVLARERWASLASIDAATITLLVLAATPLAASWYR